MPEEYDGIATSDNSPPPPSSHFPDNESNNSGATRPLISIALIIIVPRTDVEAFIDHRAKRDLEICHACPSNLRCVYTD